MLFVRYERLHYTYMRYLVAERALPNPYDDPGQEYHQPPLYYVLNAALAALVDVFDTDGYTASPPQANTYYDQDRQIVGNDNRNLYIHPRAEDFPYTGHDDARTVHILRVLSVLLATGTVIAAYACFRLLWPDATLRDAARRLLALGFMAFMPQFAYISGALNNDNLLMLLATLSLYVLLRQLRTLPSRKNAILLGVLLGLALLTKANAVFLALPTGLVVLISLRQDRRAWRYAAITLAVMFVVAGLYDPDQDRVLAVVNANGQPITPIVGRIAISGPRQDDLPIAYRFGDGIGLDEPQIIQNDDQVQVCLNWSSLCVVTVDYQIFAHLMRGDERITQADVQPRGGAYPTGAWSPGEVIADCITLDAPSLPADNWSIVLGLYNLDDFARLPVTDAQGESLGDSVLVLP